MRFLLIFRIFCFHLYMSPFFVILKTLLNEVNFVVASSFCLKWKIFFRNEIPSCLSSSFFRVWQANAMREKGNKISFLSFQSASFRFSPKNFLPKNWCSFIDFVLLKLFFPFRLQFYREIFQISLYNETSKLSENRETLWDKKKRLFLWNCEKKSFQFSQSRRRSRKSFLYAWIWNVLCSLFKHTAKLFKNPLDSSTLLCFRSNALTPHFSEWIWINKFVLFVNFYLFYV